jgi:hypothetical protein
MNSLTNSALGVESCGFATAIFKPPTIGAEKRIALLFNLSKRN